MATGFSYAILGSGKQGLAASYDALRFGQAVRLTLADKNLAEARAGVRRLRKLIGSSIRRNAIRVQAVRLNADSPRDLRRVLAGHDAVLSALPHVLNPRAAAAAIAARCHYCDLGGYFETTRKILALHPKAKRAGVTLIPDCGVSPGLCNSLAVCGMELFSSVQDVLICCGGLPKNPRPPLDYKIVFNLDGLLGNYFGKAYALLDGKITELAPLSEREILDFEPPLGRLEAAVTGGATSTCPWTFEGRVRNYSYKTLRYPGHFDKIQLLKDLGVLETAPVAVDGVRVVPRQVFTAVAGPRLRFPDDKDFLVMRVIVRGEKDGKPEEVLYELFDEYDAETGFTAMQRTTGFSAAVVMESLARGRVTEKGVVPLEKALPGRDVLEAMRQRGLHIRETVRTAA